MSASSTLSKAWRVRALLLLTALFLIITLHREVYLDLFETWLRSRAYNHCLLIPFIALFLAWREKLFLSEMAPEHSLAAVGFMLLNVLLMIVGTLLTIRAAQHIAVVGFVIALIWMLIGSPVAKKFWFPLCYLYFMVPEGEFLVPYLQDSTAHIVVTLLQWSGMPVYLDGRFLQIPSGSFAVAKACSGVNYLLASLAVGSMFAYMTFASMRKRALFMLFAIAVPLIANGIRAYGIIMIAHYSDYRYAMGVDHFIYGGVFFALIIFILFFIGRCFADTPRNARAELGSESALDARCSDLASIGVLFLGLTLSYAPFLVIGKLEDFPRAQAINSFPQLAEWKQTNLAPEMLGGKYQGAAQRSAARYTNIEGRTVDLVINVFESRSAQTELVSSGNRLYDTNSWRLAAKSASREDPGSQTAEIGINELVLKGIRDERLVWWWYQIGGTMARSGLGAKVREAQQKASGRYCGGALVVISTTLDQTAPGSAVELLADFFSELEKDFWIPQCVN